MASLNPTVRFEKSMKERLVKGELKFGDSEELDGVKMMLGVPAAQIAEQREKFAIRPDDVFIATYPKCGTTWMQQIVKLIVNNGVETGADCDVFIPWHEHMSLEEIESMPSPRFFKSHLPYQLMPGGGDPEKTKAKYICVIRNPKDLSVSAYHHMRKVLPPEVSAVLAPTREHHFGLFLQEKQYYGPFYSHFLGWWAHRDAANILILTYEQMKRDPRTAVTSVASFLEYSLTDEVIDKIVSDTAFDSMKNNKAANKESWDGVTNPDLKFMRKGVVGDWRNVLSPEESAKVDALVADKLAGSGLVFDYGDD